MELAGFLLAGFLLAGFLELAGASFFAAARLAASALRAFSVACICFAERGFLPFADVGAFGVAAFFAFGVFFAVFLAARFFAVFLAFAGFAFAAFFARFACALICFWSSSSSAYVRAGLLRSAMCGFVSFAGAPAATWSFVAWSSSFLRSASTCAGVCVAFAARGFLGAFFFGAAFGLAALAGFFGAAFFAAFFGVDAFGIVGAFACSLSPFFISSMTAPSVSVPSDVSWVMNSPLALRSPCHTTRPSCSTATPQCENSCTLKRSPW